MTRQAECIECGKWFMNHNGMMIYLPEEYDDRKCPNCNRKIKQEAKEQEEEGV